jgi:methionyl-tRNA synthetase
LPFDDNYMTASVRCPHQLLSGQIAPDSDSYKSSGRCASIDHKDILKPHGIYWPTILKLQPKPYQHLNVHGCWQIAQGRCQKFRKCGRATAPGQPIQLDQVRYFFAKQHLGAANEGALVGGSSDLANDLGNLLRSLAIVSKYQKVTPAAGLPGPQESALQELTVAMR